MKDAEQQKVGEGEGGGRPAYEEHGAILGKLVTKCMIQRREREGEIPSEISTLGC